MKAIVENIEQKLQREIPELRYISHNWGQLNLEQPPVQWPCVLIDIESAEFEDIGMDRSQKPINRQTALVNISLSVADLRLTNSSVRATQSQLDNSLKIFDLLEKIHQSLHGQRVHQDSGKMIRQRLQKIQREDAIEQYQLNYTFSMTDI